MTITRKDKRRLRRRLPLREFSGAVLPSICSSCLSFIGFSMAVHFRLAEGSSFSLTLTQVPSIDEWWNLPSKQVKLDSIQLVNLYRTRSKVQIRWQHRLPQIQNENFWFASVQLTCQSLQILKAYHTRSKAKPGYSGPTLTWLIFRCIRGRADERKEALQFTFVFWNLKAHPLPIFFSYVCQRWESRSRVGFLSPFIVVGREPYLLSYRASPWRGLSESRGEQSISAHYTSSATTFWNTSSLRES